MEISQTNFSSLLKESIRELDSSKRTNCENITIEISQCPSSEELLGTGLEHPLELLSLHEKIPHKNSLGYEEQIPEKIILFQKSIENACSSEEEIKQIITETLLNELSPSNDLS